jgi:hypothetical protein
MGEMGGCEFATVPLVLVDRGCVARTVADTGDAQQVRCRLRQERRTEKGAVPYEFQLFVSPRQGLMVCAVRGACHLAL